MTAAPKSQPSADLTVTVDGPTAADGEGVLDAYAREPFLWAVTVSRPVSGVEVAIGDRSDWRQAEWDGRHARLTVAGAELGGLPAGSHRTWVRVTDGDTVVVRPGGRLTVQ